MQIGKRLKLEPSKKVTTWILDIEAIDQDPPKQIVKDRRFEVAKNKMVPGSMKLMLGLEIRRSTEGMSTVDENASEDRAQNLNPLGAAYVKCDQKNYSPSFK